MMKKILTLTAVLLIGMNCTMAQKRCISQSKLRYNTNGGIIRVPKPHYQVMPGTINEKVGISYNATSTTLTVKFCNFSQGNTVEVYRNGAKVAGITTNGGTTFSCRLREYGTGNYTVIVSNGKTVVDSKNFTVR